MFQAMDVSGVESRVISHESVPTVGVEVEEEEVITGEKT